MEAASEIRQSYTGLRVRTRLPENCLEAHCWIQPGTQTSTAFAPWESQRSSNWGSSTWGVDNKCWVINNYPVHCLYNLAIKWMCRSRTATPMELWAPCLLQGTSLGRESHFHVFCSSSIQFKQKDTSENHYLFRVITTNNHIASWLHSINLKPCCHQKRAPLLPKGLCSHRLPSAINVAYTATQTGYRSSFSRKLIWRGKTGRGKKNKTQISFQLNEHLTLPAFMNNDASIKSEKVSCRYIWGRTTATLCEHSTLFPKKSIVHFTSGTLILIYSSSPK